MLFSFLSFPGHEYIHFRLHAKKTQSVAPGTANLEQMEQESVSMSVAFNQNHEDLTCPGLVVDVRFLLSTTFGSFVSYLCLYSFDTTDCDVHDHSIFC